MRSEAGAGGQSKLSNSIRTTVHDLRNLFTVVNAAQQILVRDSDRSRLVVVARSLELVARDGIALTTRLLAQGALESGSRCDPNRTLRNLEAMLVPLGGPRTLIRVEPDAESITIGIGPIDLQAIALELVSNSLAGGSHHVILRCRAVNDNYWLLAVDDGCGCDMDSALVAMVEDRVGGSANGTGLNRIGRTVQEAGGIAKLRSEPGKGCAIGLVFPILAQTESEDAMISEQNQILS